MAKLRVDIGGIHGAQFDDRIGSTALDTSSAYNNAGTIQGQVGRIEEKRLARLRLDRVDSYFLIGRALTCERNRYLQLNAGRPFGEPEYLDHFLLGKWLRQC